MLNWYLTLSKTKLFLLVLSTQLLVGFLSRRLLINETVFYNTFSEQLTYERSKQVFESMKSLEWIGYAIIPLLLLLKFSIISVVLYIGVAAFGMIDRIKLADLFKITIAGELIITSAAIIKFLWLYFLGGNYDLNDMSFFYPASLINLFSITEVNKLWIYPLQAVNLFQVMYIVFLSFAIRIVCKVESDKSDKIVLISYIPSFVIWISIVMLISIESGI